jgi:glutamate transport system substrate-binding protein
MALTSKWLRAGVTLTLAMSALVACGDSDARTVAIHSDVPGWGLSGGGNWSGFDYDLARWIGNERKFRVRPYDTTSQNREQLLIDRDVDLVMATYSVTDERLKKVDFVAPYMVAQQALLVRAGDAAATRLAAVPSSAKQMVGCVPGGSTSEKQLQENGYTNFHSAPAFGDCMAELDARKVQAVSTDDLILYGVIGRAPGRYTITGSRIGHLEYYGIGVRKGDKRNCGTIRDALNDFLTSGLWETFLHNNLPALPQTEYEAHNPKSAPKIPCPYH